MNTIIGGAGIYSCSGCSTGRKVGYVGNNSGAIQFNNINVQNTDTYTLIIYYCSGETRYALMNIDDAPGMKLTFSSTENCRHFTRPRRKTICSWLEKAEAQVKQEAEPGNSGTVIRTPNVSLTPLMRATNFGSGRNKPWSFVIQLHFFWFYYTGEATGLSVLYSKQNNISSLIILY